MGQLADLLGRMQCGDAESVTRCCRRLRDGPPSPEPHLSRFPKPAIQIAISGRAQKHQFGRTCRAQACSQR